MLSLHAGDIEIRSDRIQFELDNGDRISVICDGSCRYKQEDGMVVSCDRLELSEKKACFAGNVSLQDESGKLRVSLSADSITLRDGEFLSSIAGSLRLGPSQPSVSKSPGRLMFGVGVNSDAGVVGTLILDDSNLEARPQPTPKE